MIRGARSPWRLAPFVFGSGACALAYQIAWQREFRLVFGASTAASAAVLAIFIGGLGAGGIVLGRRADRHPRPLAMYAGLEAAIALSTAATPFLLDAVRWIYVAIGGSITLGLAGGTVLRLLLTALVLAVPTLLMGGTLPAAARAVETDDDRRRSSASVLYGVNTLGAVTGSVVAAFFLLEMFGTRRTLWLACLVNLLVAVLARSRSRAWHAGDAAPAPAPGPEIAEAAAVPARFVLAAALVVGFAFFLMELVWYRMMSPLLGGTVFTFALILSVALFGIGLGGAAYSLVGHERRPTARSFAITCLCEAALIGIPFVLGDRLAVLALYLRPLGLTGFGGHLLAWGLVCGIVIFPAAFVAGVQFPMLIALLGKGRADVGRQIGLAYAWNTAGAIAGSLAGGFGLLPALTAPGAWRLVVVLLCLLGLAAAALAARRLVAFLGPTAAAAAIVVLVATATGPTAAWRHSQIGVGRVAAEHTASPNALHSWMNARRRAIRWEAEGVESSVALDSQGSLALVINGKVDGNARTDAGTMVMFGLVGALLHADPRNALVVGLGTGMTAGWLGAIPSMESVEVVELEPAVLEVARACEPVTHGAMTNPRVHVSVADAREVLLATKRHYDLIVSQPSNPYRAGVASLFTAEYYRSIADRLNDGGIFLQWVQAYDVDSETLRTIYATVASVFPEVETWEMSASDLVLVASRAPLRYDAAALRARIAAEPYRSALADSWRVVDLEGLLGHYVAGAGLARAVAAAEPELNSDDLTVIEFGFARSVGRSNDGIVSEMRAAARLRKEDRPPITGEVDWPRVVDEQIALRPADGLEPVVEPWLDPAQRQRAAAASLALAGDHAAALAAFRAGGRAPVNLTELWIVATGLAEAGDESCLGFADAIARHLPIEADVVRARLRLRQGRVDEAVTLLATAFVAYRTDPWPAPPVMRQALQIARALAASHPALAPRLYEVLREPFSVSVLNDLRAHVAFAVATRLDDPAACVDALRFFEPHVPWEADFLGARVSCYQRAGDARAGRAAEDLEALRRREPSRFAEGLDRP